MSNTQEDTLMNATLVSNLPSPMMSSMNDTNSQQAAPSSYQDLIKNLDIKQMSGSNMQMPASIQMQQMPQQMPQQFPQQFPPQTSQQFPPQMPQQFSPQTSQESAMELLHSQNSTYMGEMPQSAPIGDFSPVSTMNISQGPIVNSLIPDPMFFNPPPRERKRRPHSPPPSPVVQQTNGNVLGGKIPAMDLNKIKPAILVAAIVFALLSWGAPVVAKQLTWTVDVMTGKFTSSGLIVISLLTGGIYLGISEIIRNFGNGV